MRSAVLLYVGHRKVVFVSCSEANTKLQLQFTLSTTDSAHENCLCQGETKERLNKPIEDGSERLKLSARR